MRRIIHLVLLLLTASFAWAHGEVHLILSDAGAAYQEAADEFRASYGQRAVKSWLLSDLNDDQIQGFCREANLIVPIGTKAMRALAERYSGPASVLALMVPRITLERQNWPASLAKRKLSAVYIDQPVGRSLDLATQLSPGSGKIGVLVSRENAALLKQIEQEATRRGQHIESSLVDNAEEVGPALRRLLPEIGLLLLLPDATTLNASNMQHILLGAYRQRIPVVGFSAGQLRAGAAVVLYTSPAQIGRQGGQMAQRWANDAAELPMAQSGVEFSIMVNRQVVRSLDLSLPSDEDLRRHISRDAPTDPR